MGLFVSIILMVGLPTCASLNSLSKPEEDPRITALQNELDRIEKLNTTTRRKVEDIRNRLVALQAKADRLEASLDELAGQRAPQSEVTVSLQEAPAIAGKPKRPATEFAPKPAPKKRVPRAKLKKALVFPKQSPEREYEKAYEAYVKHDFDEGIALFKKFLQRYPKHDLADNAQYWIGEIYYDMEDYSNAIIAFKEVVTLYEERGKAPDALLKIGYSYVAKTPASTSRESLKTTLLAKQKPKPGPN
jgi:tol-pal system protein YbgF